VTRINESTRVTIFGELDSTRVTWRKMVTRLESRFSQDWLESTRVTVKSELFFQNFWVLDGQTRYVSPQRIEHFLAQWWSRLV